MTREKSLLRTEFGQRVDQPDFEHSQETALNHASQNFEAAIVGQRSYILRGFLPTATGAVLTVNRDRSSTGATTDDVSGAAILGFEGPEGTEYGHVITDGPATRQLDLSGVADGNYNLWIAFSLRDAQFENRAFWNADQTAGGAVEFTRNTPTRRAADWNISVFVDTTSPGDQWLRIASLVKTGGTVTVTDRRPFFFEGNPADSYLATNDWGGGNDRDADRARFGVTDLRTFVRAVTRQFEALTGNGWWGTITNALGNFLARDGSNTMDGNITFDINGRNIGDALGNRPNAYTDDFGAFTSSLGDASATEISVSTDGHRYFPVLTAYRTFNAGRATHPTIRSIINSTQPNVYSVGQATTGTIITSAGSGSAEVITARVYWEVDLQADVTLTAIEVYGNTTGLATIDSISVERTNLLTGAIETVAGPILATSLSTGAATAITPIDGTRSLINPFSYSYRVALVKTINGNQIATTTIFGIRFTFTAASVHP